MLDITHHIIPLAAPLTGYFLEYHFYNNTSTIELPALNTSYTLDGVSSDVVYNITVSAFSDVGQSRNNPSVQFGETLAETRPAQWVTLHNI